MNTVKYIFWLILRKISFLYILLIIANVLSALFAGIGGTLAPMLPHANLIAILSFYPFVLFIVHFGIPYRKKCEKCGSKIQIFYELESGDDRKEPNKYEHFFRVTECPRCRNKEVRHIKMEKRTDRQNAYHIPLR